MRVLLAGVAGVVFLATGCSGDSDDGGGGGTGTERNRAPDIEAMDDIFTSIGADLAIDLDEFADAVEDRDGDRVSLRLSLSPGIAGVTADSGGLHGTALQSGVADLTVRATDEHGASSTARCQLVVSATVDQLPEPSLPAVSYSYADAAVGLPEHYTDGVAGFGDVSDTDNTPAGNPITDAGATLGRVLFYDKRLSANNAISCASCHQQEHGFADPRRFSLGFNGGETGRQSPGLSNARYYERGHFFWDERADTLEDQVLMPIQDEVEMGLTLGELVSKVAAEEFYEDLFEDAFGDSDVTSERIALALAQFVRAMVSTQSDFDDAFTGTTVDPSALSTAERRGLQLFGGEGGVGGRNLRCDRCHTGVAQVSDDVHNIGLDAEGGDEGAGDGAFKAPSLRNVGVRARFMHDGRFSSLRQVVEHYNSGVQAHPDLDPRLRGGRGQPIRLNLSDDEIDDLVAFLESLTDDNFLTDPRFEDPFSVAGDPPLSNQ